MFFKQNDPRRYRLYRNPSFPSPYNERIIVWDIYFGSPCDEDDEWSDKTIKWLLDNGVEVIEKKDLPPIPDSVDRYMEEIVEKGLPLEEEIRLVNEYSAWRRRKYSEADLP